MARCCFARSDRRMRGKAYVASMKQAVRNLVIVAVVANVGFAGWKFLAKPQPSAKIPGEAPEQVTAEPAETFVRVEVTPQGLLRGGKPYFIRGLGGEGGVEKLQGYGCNSLRTWSDTGLGELLDEAQKHGITVNAGIWLEHECSWFSYHNPEHCAKQLARVKSQIEKYRHHPALLLWNIGNEAEGDGSDPAYWKQLNALCRMAKEVDPHHPSINAVAGLSEVKARSIQEHCPDLDIVGINTYAALPGLRKHLAKLDWKKPWVVTEYGPAGFWERPKTSWDRPIEQTSTQKAVTLKLGYEQAIEPAGQCLGSYAFLWGQKQEATSTWFGLRLESGETTENFDLLRQKWTGQRPDNISPSIEQIQCDIARKKVEPRHSFTASVKSVDADGDALSYEWAVYHDVVRRDAKGKEIPAKLVAESVKVNDQAQATIVAPQQPGAYRLFVFVRDGKGHAATANEPFFVE